MDDRASVTHVEIFGDGVPMHWHPNMLEKPSPAADMHLSAEMAAALNAVNPWWTGIGNFHNFAAWMKQPL